MRAKITVTGLQKSYPVRGGRLAVLDGIDFSVRHGELLAVIGPSGCGKSTLLNILAGFDRPDRGQVTVDAVPVRAPSPQAIFIFQQGAVFPWLTVERNLIFGLNGLPKPEKKRLADHYAAMVGLTGFERVYPYQLSGGMLQRLEVARALVVNPEVLLMDEPFGHLDALTRLRLRGELLRILSQERHTTLLVTHDVEEALQLADRILILSPRPARVESVVEVPCPHPRSLSTMEMVSLKARILKELGVADAETV